MICQSQVLRVLLVPTLEKQVMKRFQRLPDRDGPAITVAVAIAKGTVRHHALAHNGERIWCAPGPQGNLTRG